MVIRQIVSLNRENLIHQNSVQTNVMKGQLGTSLLNIELSLFQLGLCYYLLSDSSVCGVLKAKCSDRFVVS